jgi:predicted aldo/keto reductase-like oxidoreductase
MEQSGVEESLKEYRRPFDCAQGNRGAFLGRDETAASKAPCHQATTQIAPQKSTLIKKTKYAHNKVSSTGIGSFSYPKGEDMLRKQRLGRTGLEVVKLGFGGIPIQKVSQEDAVEVVKHVINQGVDFIDTAHGYTTSEERIGLALKQVDKQIYISSKSPARTAEGLLEHLELSFKRLQVDKIDIYNCHGINNFKDYEKITGPGGALEGLKQARDKGLIDFLGITSHKLEVLEQAVSDGYFDTILVCHGFLEPKAEEKVVPMAVENDIGIMTMKNFSGGVIEDADIAIKYAIACPEAVLVPGVESIEKANQNMEIFMLPDYALNEEELARIESLKKEYDDKFCRRCDYCQPCEESIPIQAMLGMRSIIKRMGDDSFDRPWVKAALEKGKTCTECGTCLPRCPYELPIPTLIKQNVEWADAQRARLQN